MFYATIGASADVVLVIKTAPVLFAYSFIAIGVHLAVLLLVGRALGFPRKVLLMASNANVGGTLHARVFIRWYYYAIQSRCGS